MRLTKRGCAVVLLGSIAVLLLVVLGGGFLVLRNLGLIDSGAEGSSVRVVVPEGASAGEVGELLEREGVIRSALGFRIATVLGGGAGDIQAGRYRLTSGLSAREALAALSEGPEVRSVTVTFPEGSWLTDFARIVGRETHISRRSFLSTARSGRVRSAIQPADVDSLEGLLWPSTYQVDENDTAASLLGRLTDEMVKRVADVDLEEPRKRGLTPYEAVIVASMVEAEARVPADRPKVATVIYNRLARGMSLGIDATVAYAIGKRGGGLTDKDLAVDSPYNTRIHTGLPPTPIGAPGMASLRATAEPAAGDWLYFVVADCKGRHAFSESYSEFLADKAAYQALEC